MFAGTFVKLEIFSPTAENPITSPVRAKIDDDRVEFDDVSFFDLNGDPYRVVAGQFDIIGAQVNYSLLESGTYSNVSDDGFNGYALTFAELTQSQGRVSIRSADLLEIQSTIAVTQDDITFDRDTLFVNVDGLRYEIRDTIMIRLGFDVRGTNQPDWLEGEAGRDRLTGLKGSDLLAGRGGRDVLFGGDGADTLDGGSGNDVLVGGRGKDIFVFRSGGQADTVSDFKDSIDRILVRTSADQFSELTLRQAGDDVIIRDDGVSFLIEATRLSDLSARDFLF